ncbi:MAG: glucokinase [Gammaproteobacteria bacterium]|nr:glucokinase [Gammaproteobacteria bacterium]
MSTRLVADVGGTHVRFALVDERSTELRELQSLDCRDFPEFTDAISAYLAALAIDPPDSACFAVAAVQPGDHIQMTNSAWSFSRRELQASFGFRRFQLVNDFAAVALSLPRLQFQQLHALTPEFEVNPGDLLAIGPGTGLGGARLSAGSQVIPCEPGHAGLSPATELELEIFKLLRPAWGEVYAELLVSGPGLERLYQALATLRGEPAPALTAAQISANAVTGTDPLCRQALEVFCALLGSAAGDFSVSAGAYGGVYLAGGIVPHIIHFLEQSDFLQRFVRKGAMEEQLREVPVNIIRYQQSGLLGAALWPLEAS